MRSGGARPGAVDGFETAVRVLLGQQVTVRGATTLAGRLVEACGERLEPIVEGRPSHRFPSPNEVAAAPLESIGLTRTRSRALRALAEGVADGAVDLTPTADPDAVRESLLALPGVGPWTADVVALRCLHDPDVFPASDLGLRRALGDAPPAQLRRAAEAWRPWRSYAALLIWRSSVTDDRLPDTVSIEED